MAPVVRVVISYTVSFLEMCVFHMGSYFSIRIFCQSSSPTPQGKHERYMNRSLKGECEGAAPPPWAAGELGRQEGSCRLWFGAVVPVKSGFNGSVRCPTLKPCVCSAAYWQQPQLGWPASHGVCPQAWH